MLGTVDKIVGLVSDQSSFLIACETTSSVTSNPDQMPTSNQESGSKVMESMGNNMKNFRSDDEEGIKNIAGSMLGTTGNVFMAASGSVPVVSKNSSDIDLLVSDLFIFLNLISTFLLEEPLDEIFDKQFVDNFFLNDIFTMMRILIY
jgi:hypothetical protein